MKLSKIKNKKKKEKGFFYLLLLMFIGALIGGVGSGILYTPITNFIEKSPQIGRWIISHSGSILYVCVGFFSLLGLGFYLYGKRKFLQSIEKYQELYSENALTVSIVIFSLGNLISLLVFGLSGQRAWLGRELRTSSFIELGIFLIGILFFAIMQKKIIDILKKGYPEKEGDPYDLSFQKQWLSSMDEREKEEAYYAGFKAFQFINKLYMSLIVFIVLLGIHMSIQVLTYFILAFLVLVSNLVYLYYVLKKDKDIR